MPSIILGDTFTLYLASSQFATGGKLDADSLPAYRIYEGSNGTPILTGSFAKLDDSNTTGLYSVDLAMTTGNGVEAGKSYGMYALATVDSVDAHHIATVHVLPAMATAASITTLQTDVTTLIDDLTTTTDGTPAEVLDFLRKTQTNLAQVAKGTNGTRKIWNDGISSLDSTDLVLSQTYNATDTESHQNASTVDWNP